MAHELEALSKLKELISDQLEVYPTTIQQDEELVQKMLAEKNWKMVNLYNLRKLEKETMVRFIGLCDFLTNLYS